MNQEKTGNKLREKLFKYFLFFIVFVTLFIFSVFIYANTLINSLNLERGLNINRETRTDLNKTINLEAGGLFLKDDISFLYPLSNASEGFNEWFQDLEDRGRLTHLDYLNLQNYYESTNKISLSFDVRNDCERIYCFQKRLDFFDIPPVLWRGLIGVEDIRFLDHKGVDPKAILRAVYTILKSGELKQGGSTLTQQLVKNLFFTNEKTFKRKFNEIITSIYIETKFTKEEILQAYFNEVVWGSLSGVRIKGVYAASFLYFNKNPSTLTSFEASILSAMLKGPYYYHPLKNIEALKERARVVYKLLREKSFISSYDESSWSDNDWKKWVQVLKQRDEDTRYRSLSESAKSFNFFDQFILQTVSKSLINSLKEREDLRDKDLAVKIKLRDLNKCNESGCDDLNYYSKRERDLWISHSKEFHQIGSLLKPIAYQEAFDLGRSSGDEVRTTKLDISLVSGIWSPKDPPYENTYIKISQALKKSKNIPYIRLMREVGFDVIGEKLKKYLPKLKVPLSEFPSQLLGSLEMSMTELINLYSTFFKKQCMREFSEQNVLELLSNPMETTISNRVNSYLKHMRFFGKTGTSNNAFDNWFLGFQDNKVMLIWVGLEGHRKDVESLKIGGSSTSFKIYQDYLMRSGKAYGRELCSGL